MSHQLARIHDAERVEGGLDSAHHRPASAVLGFHVGALAGADAVFAGTGAAGGQRALDQALVERRQRARVPVLTMLPSAITTVIDSTFSRMVP